MVKLPRSGQKQTLARMCKLCKAQNISIMMLLIIVILVVCYQASALQMIGKGVVTAFYYV
jgi:hypothetical protein